MSRYSARTAGHHNPFGDIALVVGFAARAIASVSKGIVTDWREHRRIAANYRRLSEMPDHVLKDMAVGRSEIRHMAEHGRPF